MANLNDRVSLPLQTVTGGLVGENLLSQLKADMMLQPVFQVMFGALGERIFVDKVPSYNETILPLIEFYMSGETYGSVNSTLTGKVDGRILLPTQILSNSNINAQRLVASAIQRFLGSDRHQLFDLVPGLVEFGKYSEWRYDRLFVFQTLQAPAIDFTLNYKFDLRLLQLKKPEVDYLADLDAQLIGWVESYRLKVSDDNQDTLIAEGELYDTDQTNT